MPFSKWSICTRWDILRHPGLYDSILNLKSLSFCSLDCYTGGVSLRNQRRNDHRLLESMATNLDLKWLEDIWILRVSLHQLLYLTALVDYILVFMLISPSFLIGHNLTPDPKPTPVVLLSEVPCFDAVSHACAAWWQPEHVNSPSKIRGYRKSYCISLDV